MDKQTSTEKLKELEFRISSLEKEKQFEIDQLTKEKVEPLLKQVEQIRANIDSVVYNKYKDTLSQLHKEKLEVKAITDSFEIEEANSLWYAKGTIVYLWKSGNYWVRNEKKKTELKGVVDIYDGTQDLGSISGFRLPKKGNLIVRHLKKNGTIGLKFDLISNYGQLKNYFPSWCADGDTPTNNPVTRKRKQDEED
jgi:hypothetical protein